MSTLVCFGPSFDHIVVKLLTPPSNQNCSYLVLKLFPERPIHQANESSEGTWFHPGIILTDWLLVISSQSACLAFSPIWRLKDGVLWWLTSPFDDHHPAFDIHPQTPSFKPHLPACGSPVYSANTDFSPNSLCWLTLFWNSWITCQAQQIHAELVFLPVDSDAINTVAQVHILKSFDHFLSPVTL